VFPQQQQSPRLPEGGRRRRRTPGPSKIVFLKIIGEGASVRALQPPIEKISSHCSFASHPINTCAQQVEKSELPKWAEQIQKS
jgi:hypothetical protein